MIVLDASVLAKLFVREPLSDRAHSLVRGHSRVHAPGLVRVEVSSAIARKFRNAELSAEQAAVALALWDEFRRLSHLLLDEDGELLPAAERLSLALRHPLADCLYLAVAERHRLPLVTADRPLVDALAERYPSVRHLDAVPAA